MPDISKPYTSWQRAVEKEDLKRVSIAFKCLQAGNANEDQQKFILDFLIRIGCRTYDTDWFPDERESSFAAGRRFVGMQIVDMVNLKVGKVDVTSTTPSRQKNK